LENIYIIVRILDHILAIQFGMKWIQITIYFTSYTSLNSERNQKKIVGFLLRLV